jgi:hypothetical protein
MLHTFAGFFLKKARIFGCSKNWDVTLGKSKFQEMRKRIGLRQIISKT